MFSAALIAGGRSSRMGRDKCLLEIGGQALWKRQLQLLQRLGAEEILISCRPDQTYFQSATELALAKERGMGGPRISAGVRLIHDDFPDCGPLGGLVSVLEKADSKLLLVLAVDLPAMTAEPLQFLLQQCSKGRGAVFQNKKFHEPMAAIYPKSMLGMGKEMLASGNLKMQAFVKYGIENGQLASCALPQEWKGQFRNLNMPSDL